MRKLLCIVLVLCTCTSLYAKTFYISADGDNTDGLTPATAWQTIETLNANFRFVVAGDSILFKCGETFYGSIMMDASGSAFAPVVISSYGTGPKPKISGFSVLSGWTNVGGNIWECDAPALKNTVNILTVDDIPYEVGRTPNNSFYTYQSATITQLTSNALAGTQSYVGAEIVMKKTRWRAEKATITDQSGSTVTYIQTLPIDNNLAGPPIVGTPNYGFFLQRYPGSLDQFGEWYFDSTRRKMQLYSPVDPSRYTIKASSVDTVVLLNIRTNIIVSDLEIEGGGMYGLESYFGATITVKNCTFNNNTKAVYMWNVQDATVDGNTINNSFNGAITASNNQRKRLNITNNKIRNTGLLLGMGLFWSDNGLKAIIGRTDTTTASNYVNIIGNTIINSGSTPIQFQGSNVTVRRNVIDSFVSVLDDAGGIYTFTNNLTLSTQNYRNRLIDSNFISNAIGAPEGANGVKDVGGYYLDDQAANITGLHNTIFNIPGNAVQMNTSHDNIFIDNTIYNSSIVLNLNKRFYAQAYNNVIKRNVLYQKDSSQFNFLHTNSNLSLPTPMTITQSLTNIAVIDSNWLSNMKYAGYQHYYSSNGTTYTFPPNWTLATWRGSYFHDVNSILPPVTVTPTNTTLEINPSNKQKKVFFVGYSKIDPKGNVYNNSVTIPKWSSCILIDNGPASSTNLSPLADAGKSVAIQASANSATLVGTGSDSDGVVTDYKWTQLSGPSTATIAAPDAAVTSVGGLIKGIYVFELTVTDNNGATGKDWTQVKVNQAPAANAGTDKLVTLPADIFTITGTGTDADGTVDGYKWVRISGPSSIGMLPTLYGGTLELSDLVQGVYQFELTVTDNDGGTAKDTVKLTINLPPLVNAGPDKLITLPVNTITLTGSGSDPDGTTITYAWLKISGPSAGTLSPTNAAATTLRNLVQGIYQFQLTATDNRGAFTRDTVQVIVNQPPIADAGADKLISTPVNATTLSGSGTDIDGSIASYEWTRLSGPSSVLIVTPNLPITDLNNLVAGIYKFQLLVTDDNGSIAKDTVQVNVNRLPIVDAGSDQFVTLPDNTVSLTGTATDPDGTIMASAWAKISGPSSGGIINPNALNTQVGNLVAGIYEFELSVIDNNGAVGKDTTMMTVYAAPNQPPIVNAGNDILITLPANSPTLNGSGSDPDGIVSSYSWVKIAGPTAGTILSPNAAITTLSNLVQGVYRFELTITDDNGAVKKDTVEVKVNQPPVANAGADKLISLPQSAVSITGTGADIDGAISTYTWVKIAGPSSGNLSGLSTQTLNLSNLVKGVYQFKLTVVDDNGGEGMDTVLVTVNEPPVANAGDDKLISLSLNTVTLTGSGTDTDGNVGDFAWTKISGPGSAAILSPNAGTTIVNNLAQGVYQFELSVTDNDGGVGKDTVRITVNRPPTANAGSDKLITLPVNSTTLQGSGTDSDGSVDFAWSKLSGPASSGIIVNPENAVTDLNNLVQGIYEYELIVTDNNGAIAKDTVQVIVNHPPTANAGADNLITLPVNSVTLAGSGTDNDGTVSNYSWIKISGPSGGTIVAPGAASTAVINLVQGIYQFELTIIDNDGGTQKDTVKVTVNQPPLVNAGADKLVSLPINNVTLSGTASDAEGTISSYAWIKISGPASGTIATSSAINTIINNLVQGVYQFEFAVTDNNGAIAKDTVQVTVNQPPVANAGVDKLISLPTNTVTLSGTTSDADGTISNYAWTKISGPASGTIATSSAISTLINNLAQGVYQFEFAVTDNNGAITKDTVQVTVNQPPVVNAGADKLISLPINTVTLTGTATDADGTISTYLWTKIFGPVAGTIGTANAVNTSVNNLVQGIYRFEFAVTDNNGAITKDTVQVTVNQPPVANAGADKLISLPINTVTLTGTATDADGTISTYLWTKISGPVAGTIGTANAVNTSVNNLVQGVYQFEFLITDNNGATAKDTVQVTVNQAPLANAGADKLISLPTNTITLTGTATDADGTISTYLWTKISGPASGTIATSSAINTIVNNLVQGIYQFEFAVTDNNGAITKDTVQVTVNQPPVVNAGIDRLISLPTNNVTLTGTATDADGTISSYAWTKISGPASGMMATANAINTSVNNLVQGIYQFELAVTDNNGAVTKDTVQVTVNQPPVVNAGIDRLISLPTNNVTLTGTATDADGTISSYAWTKISGPVSGTITTSNASTTTVNSLTQGVYQFLLIATDNSGATGRDTVQVTVNQPPQANAGADKLVSLPINTVTLTGTATDADGTISSYAWTKIFGPASGTIATSSAINTLVNNLAQGVYRFEFNVTDNNGAITKDTVQVTVNQPPLVNAGADKLISLPINSTTLTGTATDADGTISTYLWTKISGPVSGTIGTANAVNTSVNNLVQGIYQFEFAVTDNNGAITKDTVQVTVNQPPLANAGADKLISLPINTVTLTGTATDADGTISTYLWTKISGPVSGTIGTANAVNTSVNNLVQGIYQFEFAVTDNNGTITKDTVQVTVNQPPLVNAGADKLISLPTNTVTLTGTASDADGTISNYAWTKISGPVSGTIGTANAVNTSVNNLVQGIYQFEFAVTDNNGAITKDTVQVTVNQPPLVNAGADKLISLPTNTVTLTGTASDADGTISNYVWTKISGPAAGTIGTANAVNTSVNNLVQGIYQFEFAVTDNNGAITKDTVQVTLNQPPLVNAGADKLISLPINNTTLTGTASDADGTISSYAWTKISGPASGAIVTANTVTTIVNNLAQGVYRFEFLVTDNNGAITKDTVQVTVNQPPVVNAGADKLISLPTNNVTLTGTATDADGTISSYAWTKISGPASGTIATSNASTTLVNSLTQGVYQFLLIVTDNSGATGRDTVQVTVNQPPVSNAGTDKLMTLPSNTASLTGSGTDVDGTISNYAWTKISGPASGTMTTPNAAATIVNGLTQGVYQYQLTVTDNIGAIGRDTLQVIVNQPPVANAGTDKVITLPVNTTSLAGSGTDPDGTVSGYAWLKISGPTTGTIATPNAATTALSSLVQGVYLFQLTVTDNRGATTRDTAQVIVQSATNRLPVANAGTDKLITLPVNSTSVTGTGTDPDGTISSYAWVRISGPVSGTIVTANAATTTINALAQGVYRYQLTVTDNRGGIGRDTVQVTVNRAPVASAGTDKLITLPTNSTSFTGSGTDADGTISSFAWVRISGPTSGTIVAPTSANTNLTGLAQGVYQYQLTVTDNRGATGRDTIQVTVNRAPVASAGTDKLMTMPINSTSLTGSGTDADGTISSYAWVRISGPASGTIVTPTAATTTVNALAQGVYQYQLTVTDNRGAIGRDTIQVTVNRAPVANAGTDKAITLPVNGTNLAGSGTDADGTISSYAWVRISGPTSGTIVTPASASTNLTGLVQGVYQYQLTVTDNRGAIGRDTVRVTVNAARLLITHSQGSSVNDQSNDVTSAGSRNYRDSSFGINSPTGISPVNHLSIIGNPQLLYFLRPKRFRFIISRTNIYHNSTG